MNNKSKIIQRKKCFSITSEHQCIPTEFVSFSCFIEMRLNSFPPKANA